MNSIRRDFVNFQRAIGNPSVFAALTDDMDAIGYEYGIDRSEFDGNPKRAAESWFSYLQYEYPDAAAEILRKAIDIAEDDASNYEYLPEGFTTGPEDLGEVDDYIGDSYSLGRRNASRRRTRRAATRTSASRIEASRFELAEYFRGGIQAAVDELVYAAEQNLGYELPTDAETMSVADQFVEEFAYNLASHFYLGSNSFNSSRRRRRMNAAVEQEDQKDDEWLEDEQEFSSKATAVNAKSGKVPRLFSMISWKPDTINLDYGGGTEQATEVADAYFEDKGVTNLIYDKYNQTAEHNRDVRNQIKKAGGADTATLSNVLNVIKEEKERINVLKNIYSSLKSGGTLYIYSYGGSKKDQEKGARSTGKDQFQNFRKSSSYADEVKQVFGDENVKVKGDLITAVK